MFFVDLCTYLIFTDHHNFRVIRCSLTCHNAKETKRKERQKDVCLGPLLNTTSDRRFNNT